MKLGNYKGLHVRQPNLDVKDSEVDNVLKREQRKNAVVIHTDEEAGIKKVLESQPIDDDFARDFSEFDTIGEWRNAIRERLEDMRADSAGEKVCRELLAQIIADSDIPIDPETKDEVFSALYGDFLLDLEEYGMTLEDYCKRSHKTEEEILDATAQDALLAIQSEAVLSAIADEEHLTVSPSEVADEINAMAEDEGEDPAVFSEELDDEEIEVISDQLRMDKAMNFVLAHAVFDK